MMMDSVVLVTSYRSRLLQGFPFQTLAQHNSLFQSHVDTRVLVSLDEE
jgi:hypothetical protein